MLYLMRIRLSDGKGKGKEKIKSKTIDSSSLLASGGLVYTASDDYINEEDPIGLIYCPSNHHPPEVSYNLQFSYPEDDIRNSEVLSGVVGNDLPLGVK